MVDPTGEIAILTCVLIGAGIGLLLGGATGAYISYKKFNEVRWKYVLIGAAAGAAIGAAAGYAIGIAIGASATTIGTAKGFASAFKITSKISSQMAKRGWTNQLIKETILKNVGRKAFNKATGNAATAYFTSSGAYVVIDNITKQIVQISNRFDPNWVVDATIKLLKGDVFIK
jgi:phage-related minor tail protein